MPPDPWSWLLGRTPGGLWRHVPYQALEPGQGQDPAREPRVEVIRQLIAYPAQSFRAVLEAIQGLDGPERPVRWLCYREPGNSPARPYWLGFVSAQPGGRRFHFGLELFDRRKLGLWFFSGYALDAVRPELLAPFPARPEVSLPRLELSDETLERYPVKAWIEQAWANVLRFSDPEEKTASGRLQSAIPIPDTALAASWGSQESLALDDSIAGLPDQSMGLELELSSARARLAARREDSAGESHVVLFPISRLSTVVGRDPRCDVILQHRNISGEHCRLVWRKGRAGVEDLESKNGTRVDGATLAAGQPRPLPTQALIELGGVPCLFVQDQEPGSPEHEQLLADHRGRVDALVTQGRLSEAQRDEVYAEAERRGITPGEVLLVKGRVELESWRAASGGGGCGAAALLLACLLLLTGCHSLGLPPIYEQDLEPQPMRERTRRVAWDFDVGLRPFFQARAHEESERVEGHLLFPLGMMKKTPEQEIVRLYPFYQRIERTDPDGFEDEDTIVFPLLFTGSHPVEGDYLYLFPFGGTLKGLLGKDEAAGVLFPLYGWSRSGETESHHLLFPIISLTYGGGASGFRFLPFYSHQEKYDEDGELVFNRTSILWPLINWASDATNSRNRFESIFIFPFWGRTRSAWMDDNTILWPLFRWWHDKQRDYREYRMPFPFLIWGSGPEHTRFDLWPLFGFRNRGDFHRHFFLWPIERYEFQETEEYVDTRLWILPVFWTQHRVYKDGRGEDRRVRIWPLFRYEDRADGACDIQALAPLYTPDPTWNFQEILAPFWRLFRYRRDTQGYARLDLLFHMWSSRWGPDGSRWDLLGGLVGHSSDPQGERTRLLWFLEF